MKIGYNKGANRDKLQFMIYVVVHPVSVRWAIA